jgi:hypothetical protein
MALILNASNNFIEIALDGLTDFNSITDLAAYGLARNAPDGLRVRKIIFVPSGAGDQVIVRDGQNGPAMFLAINVLGDYDLLKDEYHESGHIDKGKLVNPYIHANESIVGIVNQAFVIFEI